jgi:hypothetical protein
MPRKLNQDRIGRVLDDLRRLLASMKVTDAAQPPDVSTLFSGTRAAATPTSGGEDELLAVTATPTSGGEDELLTLSVLAK